MKIITDLEKLNAVIKGLDLILVDYIIRTHIYQGERCWTVKIVQEEGE